MGFIKRNNTIKYVLLIIIGLFLFFLTSCEEEKAKKIYYTVTYNLNGIKTSISVEEGETLTRPQLPIKEGYEFKGWFNGNVYYDFENNIVNSDITLSAKWEVNKYKLTIQYNNGSSEISMNYNYGEKISLNLDNLVRKGYTFDGWNIEFPETMPAHDVTLYAKWKINTYNLVIKYKNGSTFFIKPYLYNQEIEFDKTLLVCSKEGYRLVGWTEEVPTSMPDRDVIIEAIWEEIPPVEVKIIYNNGVLEDQIIKQKPGSVFPVIDTPTKEGYTFMGWSKSIPEYMPDASMEIEAIWVKTTYTLTIHDYYGENKDLTQRFSYEATIDILNPILTGYTFKGYYQSDLKTEASLSKMGSSDIEVTALWELNQYKIEYHYESDAILVNQPTTYSILTGDFQLIEPNREGYLFRGWYRDQYFGIKVTTITMDNLMDYDLYAKWDKYLLNPFTNTKLVYNSERQSPTWTGIEEGILLSGDYKEKKEAGTYTATFKPIEGYCWLDGSKEELQMDWTIQKREITLEWSNTNLTYNGYNQYPDVKVIKDNGGAFSSVYIKTTYKDAGSYEVNVEQINKDTKESFDNYIIHNGTIIFTINKATIDDCVLEKNVFIYNGQAPNVKISRVYANKKIVSNFEVSGDFTKTDVGQYNFTVQGKGNWEGSITVSYEIIKADSVMEKAQESIEATVGDSILISDLVKNATRDLSVTFDTSVYSTQPAVNGNTITVGKLFKNGSDQVETFVAVTEAGDANHNAKTINIKLIISKKVSTITFNEDYYYIDVFDTINITDIGFIITPAIENPVYHLELENAVDYLILDRTALTIKGQYLSEDDFATIRISRETDESVTATSVDIKVKVIGADGLKYVSRNGAFGYGKTSKITDANTNISYSVNYIWYYIDNDVRIQYATTSSIKVTDRNYIGKTFGCYVEIADEDRERLYNVYEVSFPESVMNDATLLKTTSGTNADITASIPVNGYGEVKCNSYIFNVSEATGHPLVSWETALTNSNCSYTCGEYYSTWVMTPNSWSIKISNESDAYLTHVFDASTGTLTFYTSLQAFAYNITRDNTLTYRIYFLGVDEFIYYASFKITVPRTYI